MKNDKKDEIEESVLDKFKTGKIIMRKKGLEAAEIYWVNKEDNKEINIWSDDAVYNYPEDLYWYRDIGDFFRLAFKLGTKEGKKSRDEQ